MLQACSETRNLDGISMMECNAKMKMCVAINVVHKLVFQSSYTVDQVVAAMFQCCPD